MILFKLIVCDILQLIGHIFTKRR